MMALLFSFALSVSGCGKEKKDILARVDEETITLTEFNGRIAKLPEQYQEIISKNKQRVLDDYIVELLLCKEAIRLGIDKEKDTRDILKEARRKILMAKFIEDEIGNKIGVEDAELRDYYEKNKDKFLVPEKMKASHILVKTEDKAKEILKVLEGGASFEELAKSESVDLTNRRGGDIGYFTKGQLVPEFEEACANLEIGKLSPIVKTNFGYHIIKLTERQPSHVRVYEEVKQEIERELLNHKKREKFNKVVEELKNKSSITVNYELITDEVTDDSEENN